MSDLNWSELWDEDEQRYRVMTRDGLKARIFTTEAHEERPVVGEYQDAEGTWRVRLWFASGRAFRHDESEIDLVPEPRTVRRWANIYRLEGRYTFGEKLHLSEEGARSGVAFVGQRKYIATVPVEWEE